MRFFTSKHHQVHKRDLLDSRVSGLGCCDYPSLSCDQHNNHGVGWKHRLFHFQFRSNSVALSTSPPHKEHAAWSAAQREPCWWPPQLGFPTSSYASAIPPSSSPWGRLQDAIVRSEPISTFTESRAGSCCSRQGQSPPPGSLVNSLGTR